MTAMKSHEVHVLHRHEARCWTVATIPMPSAAAYLETTVRLGGSQYVVVTDTAGRHTVWPAYLPRRRPMRACSRRRAIVAAVERSTVS
jgi:hypothetical protein